MDPRIDPPADPPLVTCPDCSGSGVQDDDALDPGEDCPRCEGDGEDYLTSEEVYDRKLGDL